MFLCGINKILKAENDLKNIIENCLYNEHSQSSIKIAQISMVCGQGG